MSEAPAWKKKRRPKGSHGIFRRADGQWVGTVELGISGGKRVRRVYYGRKKSEIERKIADAKARGGGTIKPRAIGTVGELVEAWLADDVKPNCRPNSYALRESVWRIHAAPVLGDLALEELSVSHVEALYKKLRELGRSDAVVRAVAVTMHAAIAKAIKLRRFHQANPFALVGKPRAEPKEARSLSAAEARRFIAAAKGDRYEALWLLLLTSGLRLGEALGLEWRDVDLDGASLVVRQAVVEVNGATSIGNPKTKRSRRSVDLGAIAVTALREHRTRGGATTARFVFANTEGGHPSRSVLRQRHLLPICKRAKIEGLTIHGLRHTMTSLTLAEGVPVGVVSERLGHSTTRMTLDRYSHVLPGQQRQAAASLDLLLGKKPKVRR